jgi:CRISPR system Cascade subunit CasE
MTTTDNAIAQTATLQMVRAEISVRDFHRWMGSKRLQDPDHAMHCLLTECFGKGLAPKPFRLVMPRDWSKGVLYGYGQAGAEELREAAGICAEPLQARIMPADKLDSKAMPTEWVPSKRLGFETRIRPMVRSRQAPWGTTDKHGRRKGEECDAFLQEAVAHPEKGGMQRSREEVYAQWLSDQLERRGGAELEPGQTKLVSFQRTRSFRKLHGHYVEGPDAVMRGVLIITDPTAFAGLLTRGIGRHRAYGFGMLLLRPPGKPTGL